MRIVAAARSDVGRVRRRNEDAYLLQDPLFAVADGMGGHRGGNVASTMSLETLESADIARRGVHALVAAIRTANRAVFDRGEADRELSGMGTTITAILVDGDRAHVAHVGDSRAYLLRDGSLKQITEDHTMVQEMVRRGRLSADQAERHPQRSILTRALGVDEELDVDELTLELRPGDRILICSDGLTGMVDEDAIARALAEAPDPQTASDRLVEMANDAGGDDNITAIVLAAEGSPTGDGDRAAVVAPGATGGATHASDDDGGEEERPRSRRRRWVIVSLVVLVVLLVGAYVGVRLYVDRQWYVGVSDGKVAVFRGVPISVAGFHLSHVDTATDLSADQAEALPLWHGLSDGVSAQSRQDALGLVAQIRTDLCGTDPSSCASTPGSPTPSPTPTATPTTSTPSTTAPGASP